MLPANRFTNIGPSDLAGLIPQPVKGIKTVASKKKVLAMHPQFHHLITIIENVPICARNTAQPIAIGAAFPADDLGCIAE